MEDVNDGSVPSIFLLQLLALKMIQLSGLSLKNSRNQKGNIEILVTGLRPGEKLYEELLIDDNSKTTSHPLIFKAEEHFVNYDEIITLTKKMEESLINYDLEKSLSFLKEIVPEWQRYSGY